MKRMLLLIPILMFVPHESKAVDYFSDEYFRQENARRTTNIDVYETETYQRQQRYQQEQAAATYYTPSPTPAYDSSYYSPASRLNGCSPHCMNGE